MSNVGCEVIVSGRVQGVGFRYFTSRQAQKLSLTGHAKNLESGQVEVLLFGEKHNVDKMLLWLETGPDTAIVDSTQSTPITYNNQADFRCF